MGLKSRDNFWNIFQNTIFFLFFNTFIIHQTQQLLKKEKKGKVGMNKAGDFTKSKNFMQYFIVALFFVRRILFG
jgi:hypothetical protein